jgi:ADP-ribose pyrophosphatase YjhB (NUDIX family)
VTVADRTVRYCTACGHSLEVRPAFGRDRPTCPSCGRIHFEDPKVAAGVLVVQQGKVLLVRRSIEPQRGRWSLPAGFVDADEDPRRAAEREALEETGLTVEASNILDVYAGREHPAGADIVLIFLAEPRGGSLRPGDDADDVAFFPPDDLPDLAFQATRRSLETWRRRLVGS